MPTRLEVETILLKEFFDNFNSSTPIALDNQNTLYFSTGMKTDKPTNSSWVRFWIEGNGGDDGTIGAAPNRRFERIGMISSQVFIPQNTGTSGGRLLCEEIVNIFEGRRFGQISCGKGMYKPIGNEENGFYMFDVTITFMFDERK